jgi:hypothetical protein
VRRVAQERAAEKGQGLAVSTDGSAEGAGGQLVVRAVVVVWARQAVGVGVVHRLRVCVGKRRC